MAKSLKPLASPFLKEGTMIARHWRDRRWAFSFAAAVALASCYQPSMKKSAYPMKGEAKKGASYRVRTARRGPRDRKPVVALLTLKDIDSLGAPVRFARDGASEGAPMPSRGSHRDLDSTCWPARRIQTP